MAQTIKQRKQINVYFSDYFGISPNEVEDYGAFNVSLINDLPLFIDPFLLFNSKKSDYQRLHESIIRYLRFLRDRSVAGRVGHGLLDAWYKFSEVKQTWLGFSESGNDGRGLGSDFAKALHANLNSIFSNFGNEKVAKSSHLEKLCLISDGVGKDNISDFTTNLIKEYLLEYTQTFAQEHITPKLRRPVAVRKVRFNYETGSWEGGVYDLPWIAGDYVLLTPVDMLTKDETWINRQGLVSDYQSILEALPNAQLREQVNHYLLDRLSDKPTAKEVRAAKAATYRKFPELLEYYIRHKEDTGDEAVATSELNVEESKQIYIEQIRELVDALNDTTDFYKYTGTTLKEAKVRAMYLKDVIENKDGYRLLWFGGRPFKREKDLQILYKLTWHGTPSDVNAEVNNGRGPVDFTVSRGSKDKTIVEFKLASNTALEKNLEHQVTIYKKANNTEAAVKVIFFFTAAEKAHVTEILKRLKLENDPNMILIDARMDNKPSASKAKTTEL